MCANVPLHPLIGSSSIKPRLPHTGLQQWYSGSPSRHVWRQMESESVSGLPEMSFTSAAHKESGHRRSRITWWKRGVSKKTQFNFNLFDPGVKESRAAGQKSRRDRSGSEGNERNHAKKKRCNSCGLTQMWLDIASHMSVNPCEWHVFQKNLITFHWHLAVQQSGSVEFQKVGKKTQSRRPCTMH